MALKNIDKWLDLYRMELDQRIVYCAGMGDAFAGEFDPKIRPQMDRKYRNAKGNIARFMQDRGYDGLFETRNEAIEHISLQKENLVSYIHMSINRCFASEQRLME